MYTSTRAIRWIDVPHDARNYFGAIWAVFPSISRYLFLQVQEGQRHTRVVVEPSVGPQHHLNIHSVDVLSRREKDIRVVNGC